MKMQCEKCQENIYDYIDCSLSENQMQSMAGHFKECADCQTFLDEELKFAQVTAELLEEGISKLQLKESVKNNIFNAVRTNQQTIRFSYPFWAKAAAVVFVAGILFTAINSIKQKNQTIKVAAGKTEFTLALKDNNQLEPGIGIIAREQAEENINQHKKRFKSICTVYDKENKDYWIRRNVIVEDPNSDGKAGFINITVTRPNSG
jgi:hypothetical protein